MMNLCAIAVALAVLGSSGFSLSFSPEPSYTSLPPIEAQVNTPEPGLLLNGPILQPPVISLPRDSPPPLAETPYEEPHVSSPPPLTEVDPPRDSTISPTPIIELPLPIMTPPPPPEGQPHDDDDFGLPPLMLPLPVDPLLPSPSEPPQNPSPVSLTLPPPLGMPPLSVPSPPPIDFPPTFPPPLAKIPYEEPHVSSPPPLTEVDPPRDSTISPTPIIELPLPIMTPPPPPEGQPHDDDDFGLPPLMLPLPVDPLLPSPSEPPQNPSPVSLTLPPPLGMPPLSVPSPPPIDFPPTFPPPLAKTPYEEPHVSSPPPLTEVDPPRDSTISPTPIIELPLPIMTPPPPPEGQPHDDDDFGLPPLMLPLPVDPLLPSPSEPPQNPSPVSLTLPPPLGMPPLSMPSPPPIDFPPTFPPPPLTMYSPPPPLTVPPIDSSYSPPVPPPIELPHIFPAPPLTMYSPPPPLVVPPFDSSYSPPPPPPIELPSIFPPPPLTMYSPPPSLVVPPRASIYAPPPIELPSIFPPPPLTMYSPPPSLVVPPRASIYAPPPIELPRIFPPPPLTMYSPPLSLVVPPRASIYAPPPIELPRIFSPPPLTMYPSPLVVPPRASSYAPPPIELPRIFSPPPLTMYPPSLAVPPRTSSYAPPPIELPRVFPPPPLTMYPLAPPSLVVPPRASAYSTPPPAMQESVPAVQSPASSRTEGSGHATHRKALPPEIPDHSQAAVPLAAPPSRPAVQLSPNPLPHRESRLKTPSEPKSERQKKTAPTPFPIQVSPPSSPVTEAPSASTPEISMEPSPTPRNSSGDSVALLSPTFSPNRSSTRHTNRPLSPPIHSLPIPPPNQDCPYLTCPEPYTNNPPGSPCGCVWPMQIGLRLSVPLYTFFPLVSELTREIARDVFMKQSQVRVVGAKEAIQEAEKTIVLVDLVPFGKTFDDITASSTSQRFWLKQILIDKSIFGDYDVLYVQYPGLPPSPPMAPADIAVINSMPYSVGDKNGSIIHPFGILLPVLRHKDRLNGRIVAVIILSAIVGLMFCFLVALVLIFKYANQKNNSLGRSSGPAGRSTGSWLGTSLSLEPGLATYPGSTKIFSASEIEKATDNFNPSRVVGEGGFGCVYGGTLEDGTSVAMKVLKRDDQQSGREFLAEVEMLKRVHHRNLVKLIGICTDDHLRCLVYELVTNGSVESHLHGADKETSPLDLSSRLKISLGAARGLAYLHEDSNPGIIHRDFKSSNILLQDDFTPKVSDFGLARIAPMDDKSRHISTQVMGTFGYVAPEYAMTGHLLVKSDVYSYGVVLLELLTGRKPVDMSQPPGEESLVAWARPFLTSKEGIESIIDQSLLVSSDIIKSFDNLAKVASIASMCVQPEVSHRPFMSEVVQALKLVSGECECGDDDDPKDDKLVDDPLEAQQQSLERYLMSECDVEKGICRGKFLSMSVGSGGGRSGSSRGVRLSASGPMRSGSRGMGLWKSIRKMSPGSLGEDETVYRTFWPGSH